MKKHLSVFALIARGSVYKVFAIIAALVIAEIAFFVSSLEKRLEEYGAGIGPEDYFSLPEYVVDDARIPLCLGVALILITFFLCIMGTEKSTKTGYTLRRLSVSERAIYIHQAAYNTLVYIFLWGVQAAVCFAMCAIYVSRVPEQFLSNQTVFLAFYRSEELHSIIPLADIGVWVRNAVLALALGITSARFPYLQRRKSVAVSVISLVIFICVFFFKPMLDNFNVILCVTVGLILMIESFVTVFREEVRYGK